MGDHLCKCCLDFALSAQEKKIAVALAKTLADWEWDKGFDIREVRDKMPIRQHSHLSAIITRLMNKGVLVRVERGKYKFRDNELVRYIKKEM